MNALRLVTAVVTCVVAVSTTACNRDTPTVPAGTEPGAAFDYTVVTPAGLVSVQVITLSVPPPLRGFPQAVNNGGLVAGYLEEDFGSGEDQAVTWTSNGAMQLLAGNCANGSAAYAVNNRGDVGGRCTYRVNGVLTSDPVIWDAKGVMETLSLPAGMTDGLVQGLNNRGDAVGTVSTAVPIMSGAVWSKGTVTVLPTPGGYTHAQANSINMSGKIVGHAWNSPSGEVPVFWDENGAHLLPVPAGRTGALAYDVNAGGWVVGSAYTASPWSIRAARWTPAGSAEILPLPNVDSDGFGITATGLVAGSLWEGAEGPAFVWSEDWGLIRLRHPASLYVVATDVSESGYVTGYTQTPGNLPGLLWLVKQVTY